MTEATLKRLINSGSGYNIARAWLGYKAISELRLKEAEPPLKVDEVEVFEAAYKLDPNSLEDFQQACVVYDTLRYNNQFAMAQLQFAARRCNEISARLDMAWMFEQYLEMRGGDWKGLCTDDDFNNVARYAADRYIEPDSDLADENESDIYNMTSASRWVRGYNEFVKVLKAFYKIPEIVDCWLMYDPLPDILEQYNKSRNRLLEYYEQRCDKHREKCKTAILQNFPELRDGDYAVPKGLIKEAAQKFKEKDSVHKVLTTLCDDYV